MALLGSSSASSNAEGLLKRQIETHLSVRKERGEKERKLESEREIRIDRIEREERK